MKQIKRKFSKAFTLIELVVVIAVIAVLGAVSVAAYMGVINAANLSNDQSTIKMINDTLLTIEALDGKPKTAGSALKSLFVEGFSAEKLQAYSSDYHYVYNLDENKFYLFDANDEPTYPEYKKGDATATTTEMNLSEFSSLKSNSPYPSFWALYNDNGEYDKVEGIYQYVCTTNITDANKFSGLVGNSNDFTIDLNTYFCAVSKPKDSKTITLQNGRSVYGYKYGDDVKEATEFSSNQVTKASDGSYSNIAVSGASNVSNFVKAINNDEKSESTKVVISDCVFMGSDSEELKFGGWGSNITEVEIKNCVFSGGKYAIDIGKEENTQFYIHDNEFVYCKRGINIQGVKTSGNIIENNTFNVSEFAIQIADYDKNNVPTLKDVASVLTTFKNNKVKANQALVRLHETLVHNPKGITSESTATDSENYKKIIGFENNSLDVAEKVILDNVTTFTNEQTEVLKTYKTYLESIIK